MEVPPFPVCGEGMSAGGQAVSWTAELLWSSGFTERGHGIFQQQRPLPLPLPRWVFTPFLPVAAYLVLGHGSRLHGLESPAAP